MAFCTVSLWIFFAGLVLFTKGDSNNVCNNVEAYRSMQDNPNCWYNYIVNYTVPEIIEKSGRPVETHKVTTDDGYILTVFRMPNNKRKHPIFLQHGLITSCANWISLGEQSLAFQLYDNGYDVWMGNYRGNHYSNEHINLNVNDKDFWEYNLDDISLRDIPSTLKHISNVTRNVDGVGKIIYIGHSLGTTMALMYSSEMVSQAKDLVELQILTAPAYKLNNLRGLPRYAVPFADIIYGTVRSIDGLMNIISKENTSRGILKTICMDSPEMMQQCMTMIMLVYGPKTGVHADKYPMYFEQHPAGSSFNILKQCADMARDKFRKFDYGLMGNFMRYGNYKPPDYDISKIQVPTIIIMAKNDWLTSKEDSINLYRNLPPNYRQAIYEITEENFNHIDFMFGEKAKKLYVDKVLTILDKYNES